MLSLRTYNKFEDLQHKIAQPDYEISHEEEETLVAQISDKYEVPCPYLLYLPH